MLWKPSPCSCKLHDECTSLRDRRFLLASIAHGDSHPREMVTLSPHWTNVQLAGASAGTSLRESSSRKFWDFPASVHWKPPRTSPYPARSLHTRRYVRDCWQRWALQSCIARHLFWPLSQCACGVQLQQGWICGERWGRSPRLENLLSSPERVVPPARSALGRPNSPTYWKKVGAWIVPVGDADWDASSATLPTHAILWGAFFLQSSFLEGWSTSVPEFCTIHP